MQATPTILSIQDYRQIDRQTDRQTDILFTFHIYINTVSLGQL